MKGKRGYNHFCTYNPAFGGWYVVGWYTYTTDRRIRYGKRHEREVYKKEAIQFCEYHGIRFPE